MWSKSGWTNPLRFHIIPLFTWSWAWTDEDSVSAEISSTGTILETPAEWKLLKVTHFVFSRNFRSKCIYDWPGNVSSSVRTTLTTDFLCPTAWPSPLETELQLLLEGLKLPPSTPREHIIFITGNRCTLLVRPYPELKLTFVFYLSSFCWFFPGLVWICSFRILSFFAVTDSPWNTLYLSTEIIETSTSNFP